MNITKDTGSKELAQMQVMAEVQARFPPEFLNRLSAIVIFNTLGEAQLERIVQKSMDSVQKRLASRGI